MTRYIIDIEENNIDQGEKPLSVYLRKVNIDPKGYKLIETHGKSLRSLLNRCVNRIVAEGLD